MIRTFCDCCGAEISPKEKRWPFNPEEELRSWENRTPDGPGTKTVELPSLTDLGECLNVKITLTYTLSSRSGRSVDHICYDCIWRALEKLDSRPRDGAAVGDPQ